LQHPIKLTIVVCFDRYQNRNGRMIAAMTLDRKSNFLVATAVVVVACAVVVVFVLFNY
jgi:hypothetical protein